MATQERSNRWWGVLVALLVGLILGFLVCKYNWLRPIGFASESVTSSLSNGPAPAFTQNLCPALPQSIKAECTNLPTQITCVPAAKAELSCKAPSSWLKKPAPQKPIVAPATKAKVEPPAKPQAPKAPVAEQQQPALMPLGEVPKVTGCEQPNQNVKENQKC